MLVHDVVAVKDRRRFVAGQQHGDVLGYARADQVPRRGASTIVEERCGTLAVRHASRRAVRHSRTGTPSRLNTRALSPVAGDGAT